MPVVNIQIVLSVEGRRENMLWQSCMAIIVGEREEHRTPRHGTGLEQGQAKHSGENGVNKVKERKIMMRGK